MSGHHDRSPSESDDASLAALFRAEAPRLLRLFRRNACVSDDSADLLQETFARYAGRPQGSTPSHPLGYLWQIARNLLRDRSRSSGREPLIIHLDASEPASLATPATQEHHLEAADLLAKFHEALATLPPRTREVFLLHRAEKLSYKEIAATLNVGVRTVEWHMREALLRLRRALDENCR